MFVCLECWQVLDNTFLHDLEEGMPCPIRGCGGSIFNIDENFIAVIRLLNEKGYATSYCCCGHVWDIPGPAHAYIAFQDGVEQEELEPLPKGWKIYKSNQVAIIRAEFHGSNPVRMQLAIFEGIKAIAKWALRLKLKEPELFTTDIATQ